VRGLLLLGLVACATPAESVVNNGGAGMLGDAVYFSTSRMDLGTLTLRLPTSLVVNGEDVLKPREACRESLIGVQLYPAAATAVGDAAIGMTTAFDVDLHGSAVFRMTSSYSVPYSCTQSGMQMLTGSTTYTFFPSGRVIRRDHDLVATTTPLPDSTRCTSACSPGDPFHFTSFWAFRTAEVVDAKGASGTVLNAPACVIANGATIAIKYSGTSTQAGNFNEGTIVSQDLAPSTQAWPGDLAPLQAESQILIQPGTDPLGCKAVLDGLSDPPLEINGESIAADQGIYMATQKAYTGVTTIRASAGQPFGFALMIDLGGADHARVTFDGNVSDYYSVQVEGKYAVFYFPTMSTTDVLTIEPL
jgi:hypothetical protein